MKKIGAIFFLVCFLTANSGIAISVHWCGGKLTGISFLSERHNCDCGKFKRAMKAGCCKDKLATLKAKNDLNADTQIIKNPTLKEVAVVYSHEVVEALLFQHVTTTELYRPPPDKPKLPCYLLNRVLLI